MFDDRIGNLQKMLARMGPEGRQKYAADHADDPIAVSMALFVNNIAKEIKEGKRGEPDMPPPVVQQAIQSMTQPQMPQGGPPQQGPPQGGPPQGMPQQGMPPQGQPQAPQGPPQGMPPPQGQPRMAADGGYMDSRLPEEMGIGALPERSLSNMADGGIIGFADGGDSGPGTTADYRRYALTQAAKMGLDPQFVDSILSHESRTKEYPTGYDPNAKSGSGSTGIGQLISATGEAYGVAPEERTNPIKNIDASLRFMKDLQKKYNNDPRLMAVAYNQGETVLNNHLKKNDGVLVPDNLKKEIAESLTKKGNLTPEQVAQRAVEPVNYLKRTVDKPKDTANPFGGAAAPAAEPPPAEQGAAFRIYPKSGVRTVPKATAAAANEAAARNALVAQIPGDNNRYVAPQKTSKDTSDKSFSQFTGNEQVVGAGEAALGLGTGLVDYLGSATKGLFTGTTGGDVQKAANESMGSATYDPRSEAGRVALENSQKFLTDTLKLPPFIARIGAGTPYPAARFVKPKETVSSTSVPAAAPTPAVRTVPTQAQVAAGNPSVTTAKPPVAQPPVVTPRLEGLQRINQAQKNNAAIRLAAEQEAAAKAGAPSPPNLVLNPRVVSAKPKTVEVAGLPAIIEQTAAKETVVPAANLIEFPKTPPRITYPNVVTSLAKNAGAAATATDGASSAPEAMPFFDRTSGDDTRGFPKIPQPYEFTNDRKSGDDTTQFPSITPKIAETAVALAQAEIPKKEQSGFGYEDLMMFGLNLMAGKSSNALTNVGTAGIAALSARQARAKAESDRKKEESDALKNTAYSKYIESLTKNSPGEIKEKNDIARLAAEGRIEEAQLRRAQLATQQGVLNDQRQAAHNLAVEKAKQEALAKNANYRSAFQNNRIAELSLGQNPSEEKIKAYQKTQDLLQDAEDKALKGFNPPKAKFIGFE